MKKFNVFTCLFYGTVIAGCIYLGFFLGSILHPGMTLSTFVPAIKGQMEEPFNIKVTACTSYTMAAVFLTAVLYTMVQKTNKKNYRFGKEHGSARWAEAAALTKQLVDKSGTTASSPRTCGFPWIPERPCGTITSSVSAAPARARACSSLNATSWRCRAVLPPPTQKGSCLGAQGII